MRFTRRAQYLVAAAAVLIISGFLVTPYVSGLLGSSSQPSAIAPILWESTIFNMSNGETVVQAAAQFHANFIFRGAFQWGFTQVQAGPESSSSFFQRAAESIKALKQSNPHLIFEGGFGTQFLPKNATWVNGTALSRASFDHMVGKNATGGWLPLNGYYGYEADLASPSYRTYVAQWSERQIDEGVDGMFFDDPYLYASYLVSVEHQNPALVYNEYAGYMGSLVQTLQSYASAQGRTFFATINSGLCDQIQTQLQYPALIGFVSYISCSPEIADFNATANPSFQPVENFTQIRASITSVVKVPIMVFVDWPPQQFMLGNLTSAQQVTALTNVDHKVTSSGMIFVNEVFHFRPLYDSVVLGTYSASLQLSREHANASNGLEASPILMVAPKLPGRGLYALAERGGFRLTP